MSHWSSSFSIFSKRLLRISHSTSTSKFRYKRFPTIAGSSCSFTWRHSSSFPSGPVNMSTEISEMRAGAWDPNILDKLDSATLKRYSIPLDSPVCEVECRQAFSGLTLKEKLYAHYMSQAAWVGGLIVPVQVSPESPAIFSIVHDAFKTNGFDGLESLAKRDCGFDEEDWNAFVVYSCGVLSQCGNYKGYGDTKFIPVVKPEKLDKLMGLCKFTNPKALATWQEVKGKVYSLMEKERQLGMGDTGTTTYFSWNFTRKEAEFVGKFLEHIKLEPWMTRAFKIESNGTVSYEIRTASSRGFGEAGKAIDFEGKKFTLTTGDYSPLMKLTCEYLQRAMDYAANEEQRKMLTEYIKSFTEGDLEAHKDGSRWWVKDQSPVVETYIGFIESYRDPLGSRSEFEGFVALVNRELSKKFFALVENAESILKLLPWPAEFERKTFMKPDFTYLDVLTFSGSGIPIGINIPNYDEIRQKEGFKNVTLGNRLKAAFQDVDAPFFSKTNQELMKKYFVEANELQTGLHELLGHGSGLNFMLSEDGTTDYPSDLRNPLNNELVEGGYKPGETYNSVFVDFASSFEECRAETIATFLSLHNEVLKIFNVQEEDIVNVRNVNWLIVLYDGIRSLDMYQPDSKKWMQAHSQAAFVTLQVLLQDGDGVVSIEEIKGADGKPDLLANLNFNAIDTAGRKALSNFILKLQVYKSTANVQAAREMYSRYSMVSDTDRYPWLKWREIVLDRRLPKKMCLLTNTMLTEDKSDVIIQSYERSTKGLIQSVIERLPDVDIYAPIQHCYEHDKPHFS